MATKTKPQTVRIPKDAPIVECMHCCGKVWQQPIDASIAKQEFRPVDYPAGTIHECKGLKAARRKAQGFRGR